MRSSWFTRIVTVGVVAAFVFPAAAPAFVSDFFDGDASGNAVYEDMVIRPEALFDPATGKTIVAYQGRGMNPYIAAYDHETRAWEGPYLVGSNPLTEDAHGGPSLIIDSDGYIHVFYGAHLGSLQQSRSVLPNDISAWVDLGQLTTEVPSGESTISIVAPATYPQPILDKDERMRLFYRSSESGPTNGYWYSVVSTDGIGPWVSRETVLQGIPTLEGWYANFDQAEDGDVGCGFLLRDFAASQIDYFQRRNAYYMHRDHLTGAWLNAAGESVPETRTKETLDASCLAYDSGTDLVNQVVVRETPTGPYMLFVSGVEKPRPSYNWMFTKWSSADSTWTTPVKIAPTDHLFDAGTFQVLPDGTIEAFLTTGGVPDETSPLSESFLAARGGDIVRYVWSDDGAKFTPSETLKASPGPWARYNDPQIVDGYDGGPRVFFSEWNNDFANYVCKVFLWGDDGFARKEFTPESKRLAGANRVETAVQVSQEAFISGAVTVVIASKANFPDALCGAPLAYSLRAPILLTDPYSLDASVIAEIKRLGATKAILLGSPSALSATVASQVARSLTAPARVTRVGGKTRYETSALIAEQLADVRGVPSRVAVASGADFPDSLAISPLAARKNMPILLTNPSVLVTATAEAIVASGATDAIIVGSEAAVSASVETSVEVLLLREQVTRFGGDDRWETARQIDDYALTQGMSLERFVVTTGENFPDALAGGVLAARMNAPLLLTHTSGLTPITAGLLYPVPETLRYYILGSDSAVAPEVTNEIAARLFEK